MIESSKSINYQEKDYDVLVTSKKCRYAIVKDIKSGSIFIADICNFKILYKLQSKNYEKEFIFPKSVVLGLPKTRYLKSKTDTAYIFFLIDYYKYSKVGIIVFENNVLSFFNFSDNSMVRLINLEKVIIQMYYTFQLEDDELFSGYNLIVRYMNKNHRLNEIQIAVLNREKLKRLGGISIESLAVFRHGEIWQSFEKLSINISELEVRELDVLNIPNFRGNFIGISTLKNLLSCIKTAYQYNWLS